MPAGEAAHALLLGEREVKAQPTERGAGAVPGKKGAKLASAVQGA